MLIYKRVIDIDIIQENNLLYFILNIMLKKTQKKKWKRGKKTAELRHSLLWIGRRGCSHKNGILDWVVVFVSFNIKRKKEF